jgi:hypothetical protein
MCRCTSACLEGSIAVTAGWCFRSCRAARDFADRGAGFNVTGLIAESLCFAISSPRSQVSERFSVAGSLRTCQLKAATTVSVFLLGTLISMAKREWRSTQCRNVAVLGAAQQIAFPMTRNRSVLHFRRPFADRDGIDDLSPGLSADGCMARAAHAPLRAQVPHGSMRCLLLPRGASSETGETRDRRAREYVKRLISSPHFHRGHLGVVSAR